MCRPAPLGSLPARRAVPVATRRQPARAGSPCRDAPLRTRAGRQQPTHRGRPTHRPSAALCANRTELTPAARRSSCLHVDRSRHWRGASLCNRPPPPALPVTVPQCCRQTGIREHAVRQYPRPRSSLGSPPRVPDSVGVMSTTDLGCLTVVMPCYNEASTLEKIVAAVMASPLVGQLIIVDDCSTDGTADVVDGLHDPRLHTVRHATNQGKG